MDAATLQLAPLLAQAGQQSGGNGDQIYIVWAILCFGLAIVLVVLEAFLPSGGVLGGLGGLAAIAGIAFFFGFDTTWGLVSMAVTLFALPFVLGGLVWVWPNTPIGQALTLKDEPHPESAAEPVLPIGTQGTAVTDLRPVGSCKFDGKRTDCLAVGGLIEVGTPVKVVDVEGTTIKVRAAEVDQTKKPTN